MAEILKVQLEDSDGNTYYLKTDANNVYCEDGFTVQHYLNNVILKDKIINNTDTADSTKVASSYVTNNLQKQINTLSNNLKNNEIAIARTSSAWLSISYKAYDVCEYTVQSDGVYIAVAKTVVSEHKSDRQYYFSLVQNSNENGSEITLPGNGAYNIEAPLSFIFTCKTGDRIYTQAMVNYVANGEAYAGLATGYLKLIKVGL